MKRLVMVGLLLALGVLAVIVVGLVGAFCAVMSVLDRTL